MANVFVFTAGSASAREHLDTSIRNPIPYKQIINLFNEVDKERINNIYQHNNGELYAWGAVPGPVNIPNWEMMQKGDWILCVFDNHYHYTSVVIDKFQNADAAKAIWGVNDKGETWEYMYFLAKPQTTNVHVEVLSDYFPNGYRGFAHIADERLARIEKDYGYLFKFFEERKILNTMIDPDIPRITPLPFDGPGIDEVEADTDESGAFDPHNEADDRKRTLTTIVKRRGQKAFRNSLINAYKGRCCISGADALDALEAAHISPYKGEHTNHVTNGLLMRADLHTLFDLGLLSINPNTRRVHLAGRLLDSSYSELSGKPVKYPDHEEIWPNEEALNRHFMLSSTEN